MTEVPSDTVESAVQAEPMASIQVRLGDLGLAKENLRSSPSRPTPEMVSPSPRAKR